MSQVSNARLYEIKDNEYSAACIWLSFNETETGTTELLDTGQGLACIRILSACTPLVLCPKHVCAISANEDVNLLVDHWKLALLHYLTLALL